MSHDASSVLTVLGSVEFNASIAAIRARVASVNDPESLLRMAPNIREAVEQIREHIAEIESKLPTPTEVKDAA